MTYRVRKAGFTLVEILIVVVILGILAAVVIPQFSSASESARASSLVTQVQTLRSQLELYQVQHNGSYPALNTFWTQMNGETLQNGTTPGAGNTAPTYGPYLQKQSRNPFEQSSSVAAAAAAGEGWEYNATTGSIYGVVAAAKATELDLSAEDVQTY